jgi:hypothetical protein
MRPALITPNNKDSELLAKLLTFITRSFLGSSYYELAPRELESILVHGKLEVHIDQGTTCFPASLLCAYSCAAARDIYGLVRYPRATSGVG